MGLVAASKANYTSAALPEEFSITIHICTSIFYWKPEISEFSETAELQGLADLMLPHWTLTLIGNCYFL